MLLAGFADGINAMLDEVGVEGLEEGFAELVARAFVAATADIAR
jgi:hypothetical protein